MKFTVNPDDVSSGGTCYQGCIDISYDELVELLGEPDDDRCDGYKTDAEWLIEFADGEVATIYNYKDGQNYLGAEGIPTYDLRDWHIGGASKEVVRRVYRILGRVYVGG